MNGKTPLKFDGKYKDIVLFGRVISAGLVVAGYTFAGGYIARWLETKGYSSAWTWLVLPGTALFGLWQGWLFLSGIAKRDGRSDKGKEK